MSEIVEAINVILNNEKILALVTSLGAYLILKGMGKLISSPHIEIKRGIGLNDYIGVTSRIDYLEDELDVLREALRMLSENG